MAEYVVYRTSDGEIIKGGSVPDADIGSQAGEGEVAVSVPPGVLTWPTLTLAPLRDQLLSQIDADAETRRLAFITPGAGQALTYQYKVAEARAWLADNTAVTPFLSAESAATGEAVADIAAEVVAQANAWIAIGSKIEAARIKAKDAVTVATDLAAIFTAAAVDWTAITA